MDLIGLSLITFSWLASISNRYRDLQIKLLILQKASKHQ